MTLLSYYTIPAEISKTVCDEIINQYYNDNLVTSKIGSETDIGRQRTDSAVRKSKQCGIANDNWISGMMSHFVHSANNHHYKFDLTDWKDCLQFTVYDDTGDHYNWHIDAGPENLMNNFIRKLSIVMCLSSKDDYDGGEFEIYYPCSPIKEQFKLNYGDVIVFPSILQHRVRPVKSGKRFSIVGWMGGPPFK